MLNNGKWLAVMPGNLIHSVYVGNVYKGNTGYHAWSLCLINNAYIAIELGVIDYELLTYKQK